MSHSKVEWWDYFGLDFDKSSQAKSDEICIVVSC